MGYFLQLGHSLALMSRSPFAPTPFALHVHYWTRKVSVRQRHLSANYFTATKVFFLGVGAEETAIQQPIGKTKNTSYASLKAFFIVFTLICLLAQAAKLKLSVVNIFLNDYFFWGAFVSRWCSNRKSPVDVTVSSHLTCTEIHVAHFSIEFKR